jgi:glycosyltransferase involved in cell wall biosynthesis
MTLEMAREQTKQLVQTPPPPRVPEPALPPAKPARWRNTKTVSAIIPLYNGERFIERSLRSVLSQTMPPLEVIVVDDGSSDDGAEVVNRMRRQHPEANIRLLQKHNGGQSSARNHGAAHAEGDLLAFLDQDDEWYARHLQELARPFRRPPAGQPLGWVYSNLDEADESGHIIHHNWLTVMGGRPEHPKRNLYAAMASDMFVLPSASVISKEVFNAVGGFDERLSGYEDDDLFLRMFHNGYNNIFLDVALSKWCIHHSSSSYTPRMRRSRVIYSHKLLDRFADEEKRQVFFRRDIILPRFYGHALAELRDALSKGDVETVAETLDEVKYLLSIAAGEDGGGIHNWMTQQQAARASNMLRPVTPERALQLYRLRRKLGHFRNAKVFRQAVPLY